MHFSRRTAWGGLLLGAAMLGSGQQATAQQPAASASPGIHRDEATDAARPRGALYERIQLALARYRQLEPLYRAQAPLAPAARGVKRRPGILPTGAEDVRQRLVLLGDMAENAAPVADGLYSAELEDGVRRFQQRHGLLEDGIAGKATLSALAVPLAQRIGQLELTLERLRQIPALPPGPLIVVNVPSFRLWAFDTRQPRAGPQLEMRTIVGTAGRTPTPLFMGQLRHVEFNPVWNVPRSIALAEIVPRLDKDPAYLDTQDMELVSPNGAPYTGAATPVTALRTGAARLRQRAGPRNVLGAVKFAMPNPMNIYLHATAARELFAATRRDLSHGCIRLEKPDELAEFVLRGETGWDRARVLEAMAPGPTTTVHLGTPIPVILFYATAIVDRDGRALFLEDVYGYDAKLTQELELAAARRGDDD